MSRPFAILLQARPFFVPIMSQDRLHALLIPALQAAFQQLFDHAVAAEAFTFQSTRPEFEGDVTINVFPFLKISGKGPEPTAQVIGEHLQANVDVVERFNVVKGFLNLKIADGYWIGFLQNTGKQDLLQFPSTGKEVMVEYASPNTNKPLHLGHMRNIFLGHSVSRILEATGNKVVRVQVINDRGIHICKSMLAWKRKEDVRKYFGELDEQTPASMGLKGDKVVGRFYVSYEKLYKGELKNIEEAARVALEDPLFKEALYASNSTEEQRELIVLRLTETATQAAMKSAISAVEDMDWINSHLEPLTDSLIALNIPAEKAIEGAKAVAEKWEMFGEILQGLDASVRDRLQNELSSPSNRDELFKELVELLKQRAPIHMAAQEMLRKWEANDPEVRALWEKMNGWVYEGFQQTYDRMGVVFDKNYYESQTYVLGKEDVLKGLRKGVFYEKDGAVWVDNTKEGLDEKVLLRSDGTSVYMTQDIGTAIKRFEEFPGLSRMIYTVGNEQDYHFKVLFLILKKLGFPWADELHHLSYGMVDLPTGKMKSREGTVVDADDLMEEVVQEARASGEQLSKLDNFSEEEKAQLFEMIGMAAVKYYLLKVDAKKRMLFDPAASIDLQGHTGPFIQYTYARIKSLLRRTEELPKADTDQMPSALLDEEREVIKLLHHFPAVLLGSATALDPSSLANHTYELVKAYNGFYQTVPVLKEDDPIKRDFRIGLSHAVAVTTKKAMWCLGIEVPERM